MVTEKAVYIAGTNGLKDYLPDGEDDSLSEADNQIRMLKSVIKNTFPQADVPLLVSSDTINNYPNTITYSGTSNEYVNLGGPYEYDSEEDKVLRLDSNSDIELVVEGSYPIGMVFWSMLTLGQMQGKYNKNGAVYVLANGGPVTTSQEYYKITNKTTVPNVMAQRYIRPTFVNPIASGQTTHTLEPAEEVQLEMTAPETGFSLAVDTKTHRHNMDHAHSYTRFDGLDQRQIGSTSGYYVAYWSPSDAYTGDSNLGLEGVPNHTHPFTFLNTVPGSNELNRLTLSPFIRIN